MKDDLKRAVELLKENAYTCILCKDEQTFTDTRRGVKPLIDFVESGEDFKGFSAADKIVGKAAALLYTLLGVREVYAQVLSEAGKDTLEKHGITPFCEICVKEIRNRAGTGICPMEETVTDITDPKEGLCALKKRLELMMQKR